MNVDYLEFYRPGDNILLPELRGLGYCKTFTARLGGPRVDGLDCFEFGYLHSGSIEWLTLEGLDEAHGGSIVIDLPGDFQGGVDAIVLPCERFWVRLDPNDIPALPGVTTRARDELKGLLDGLTKRHFRTDRKVRAFFERILEFQRNQTIFSEELSRAALHEILFNVLAKEIMRESHPAAPQVQEAKRFIEENLSEDISVEVVAEHLALSPGYFHEIFQRDVGTTPARYILKRRLAVARHNLIRTDASITSVGHDLGFSTSQYFATVFKRFVGVTPREYRNLRKGVLDSSSYRSTTSVPEVIVNPTLGTDGRHHLQGRKKVP